SKAWMSSRSQLVPAVRMIRAVGCMKASYPQIFTDDADSDDQNGHKKAQKTQETSEQPPACVRGRSALKWASDTHGWAWRHGHGTTDQGADADGRADGGPGRAEDGGVPGEGGGGDRLRGVGGSRAWRRGAGAGPGRPAVLAGGGDAQVPAAGEVVRGERPAGGGGGSG